MAMIRSLLRVRPRTVAAPLPLLPVARSPALRRSNRRVGASSDRHLAVIREANEPGRNHALVLLDPAFSDRLRFILLLHDDRPHRRGIVILDHVNEGPVRPALD